MEILELTRQALHLLAPFVAADAPAQTDATSPDRTTHPVARAWELIGSGVQDNPPAEQALAIYRDEPDDQRNRERLARLFPERTDIRELCAWLAAQLPDG